MSPLRSSLPKGPPCVPVLSQSWQSQGEGMLIHEHAARRPIGPSGQLRANANDGRRCRALAGSPCVCAYLLIRVEGIDVFDGRGEQLRRELRRHPYWQRHPALQRGVRRWAVVVHIVVVADLKWRNSVEESS